MADAATQDARARDALIPPSWRPYLLAAAVLTGGGGLTAIVKTLDIQPASEAAATHAAIEARVSASEARLDKLEATLADDHEEVMGALRRILENK